MVAFLTIAHSLQDFVDVIVLGGFPTNCIAGVNYHFSFCVVQQVQNSCHGSRFHALLVHLLVLALVDLARHPSQDSKCWAVTGLMEKVFSFLVQQFFLPAASAMALNVACLSAFLLFAFLKQGSQL